MAERTLGALVTDTHELSAGITPSFPRLAADGTIIRDVEHDSRRVRDGSLFCCVVGESFDGHRFAPDAVEAGASALLVERPLDLSVAQVPVANVRQAMPWFASAIHDLPSRAMQVVGITGTNGKTTITHLLAAIAGSANRRAAVIGTLSGARTTPESTELQRTLASMRDAQTELVAMEVSSHALSQHRVDGTDFAVALFTNLTPDHLDFHQSMDAYFEAKATLFDGRAAHAVINTDDPYGQRLLERVPDATTFCLADVILEDMSVDRSIFVWHGERISLPLGGDFNVSNACGAAEAALLLGFSPTEIADGLSSVDNVPGRMEVVSAGLANQVGAPLVVVDYSHTPDGIDKVLSSLRPLLPPGGRIAIVFGCGGDRDTAKRPLMGAAAAGADVVIVTSDNPRSEDPIAIINDILPGIREAAGTTPIVEPDRRLAIALALATTNERDIVLIAGKGHETTQTTGDRVEPFDDRVVARELLDELA